MINMLANLPKKVTINEVGPRDGMQNLTGFVPTEKKIKLINMLIDAGIPEIELTSFVNPKWVEQMKDAAEIIASVADRKNVVFTAVVPNVKGAENALKTNLKNLAFFFSISEHHNKANVNKTSKESMAELKAIAQMCHEKGVTLKANIATAFGYTVEGYFPKEQVAEVCQEILSFGIKQIVLCDTVGMSNPRHTHDVISEVRKLGEFGLGMHLHQLFGREYANAMIALMCGLDYFDLSVGGLGGCPFAPGASGNMATENFVEMLTLMGIETGVDAAKINAAAKFAKEIQLENS
jgi:hydroxymethylglutaryl-CoA lyase